jgi:Zn-dependent peptidase ImmA (M78 family)
MDAQKALESADLGFPVDVEKAAAALGIELDRTVDAQKLGYSGEISLKDGKPQIWLNPYESETRQRFTAAHEIGHFILHLQEGNDGTKTFTDNLDTLRRGESWNPKEYEANAFAARMLMPAEKIKEIGLEVINQLESEGTEGSIVGSEEFVKRLAKRFDVSSQAMLLRLKNLGVVKAKSGRSSPF